MGDDLRSSVQRVLDPQHLLSFREIARSGSYSAAARRLGYSQPALSYQMRALERAVGAPLTARAGRGIRLTPAGLTMLRHADQILTAIRVAERDLAQVVSADAGALRLAAFASAASTIVPVALAQMIADRPAIDSRLVQADPDEATRMVARGDSDIAITYRYRTPEDLSDELRAELKALLPETPERGRFARVSLVTDHLHLVMPRRHPLANTTVTGLWPFADEAWLIASDLFSELIRRAAARAGFAARVTRVADDYVTMQSLVAQGIGLAILPGLALVAHHRDDVVAHRLTDWPVRHVDLETWPDLLRVGSVSATVDALRAAAIATIGQHPTRLDLPATVPVDVTDHAAARSVPWRSWFERPQVAMPAFARDRPGRGIVVSERSGSSQVHRVHADVVEPTPVTTHAGGVPQAAIDPAGRTIWWFRDHHGDELGIWMVQPFDAEIGAARPAAPMVMPGFASGLSVGTSIALLGRSDAAGAEIFVVDPLPTAGAPTLVYAHPQFAAAGPLSHDEELATIVHSEHGDAQKPALRVVRLSKRGIDDVVADLWDGPGFGLWPVAFSPRRGSTELLITHERGGLTRPLIWDPVAGTQREIEPDLAGDTTATWFADGRALLLTHQHRARSELYRFDLGSGVVTLLPTRRGSITDAVPRPDGSVDYLWSSATSPPLLLNTADGTDTTVGSDPGPSLADRSIAGPGGDIHVLIARPDELVDADAGPQPTVLLLHGGPAAQDMDAFSAVRNAWVSSGYTAVHVNYRGSTGYGAAWRNANIGRPGRIELEDVVAVRDALVADGTADPTRLIVAGRSWGGYLALLGLGLHPDLWSMGIALVPVADTATVYEDMMEEIRAAYRVRFGGSPTDVPDVYTDSSPLSVVEEVVAPVLLTGGVHDTRCPIRQIELYESRLVELGKQHELHIFDHGHTARSPAARIEEMSTVLAFAERHHGPTTR